MHNEPTRSLAMDRPRDAETPTPDSSGPRWFYIRHKQKLGPAALAELQQAVGAGQLLAGDMVLQEGSSRWVEAASIPGLFATNVCTAPSAATLDYALTHAPTPGTPTQQSDPRSAQWHYISDKQKHGPVSLVQLQHMVAARQLEPASMLLREGTGKWVQARAVPGLFPGSDTQAHAAATLDHGAPATISGPIRHRDFGDYELLAELARGGMGVVYRARQKSLNRIVALKMILAGHLASPEQVRRFRVEAEQAGNLDHPNIVPIYDVGERDGQHYFSMKLIEGGSLAQRLSEYRLPTVHDKPTESSTGKSKARSLVQEQRSRIARLMTALAQAVHYAHQRGILHRDIKPGNILLDGQGQPHITDFGLAKHLGGQQGDTNSGAILGTPSYMAPEQAAASKDLSTAVDVYSLGAVLYELLTGRPPFQAATPLETVLQVMEREPARPRAINPMVDQDLETICLTCLAKEPTRRYPSALALATDLERYLAGEPIHARPVSLIERTIKWGRRRPAVAALVGVTALTLLVMTLGSWWSNVRLKKTLGMAESARVTAEGQKREADRLRIAAQTNADEAKLQADRAHAQFQKRLENLDQFLVNLDGRLANMSSMHSVRLEFLQEFLKLSEGHLKEQEKDASARWQTALIYRRMGDVQSAEAYGDYKSAEASYRKALELQKGLADEFPDKPAHRNEMAHLHQSMGDLLQVRRRYDESQAAYRSAIVLLDQLSGEQNDQPEFRSRAAFVRFSLADLLEYLRKPAEAELLYREALRESERAAAASPERASFQVELAADSRALGLLLIKTDLKAAQQYLEQSNRAIRQAIKLDPAATSYLRLLRDSYNNLAVVLKQRGEHERLSRLCDELLKDLPGQANDTYNAACYTAYALSVVQESKLPAGERDRLARTYGDRAMALLTQAVKQGYKERSHFESDPDLKLLKSRPDYPKLLASMGPARPPTPEAEFTALSKEFETVWAAHKDELAKARTEAERRLIEERKPRFADFAERLLQLAEKHKDAPVAVQALAYVLDNSAAEGGKLDPAAVRVREKALKILEREYFPRPDFAEVCVVLARTPVPEFDEVLRAALAKHNDRDVRGLACFALGLSLANQAERLQPRNELAAREMYAKAEQHLVQVVAQHGTVPFGRSTLGELAKFKVYELRHLSVGKEAPAIDGEDLDGRTFKLSDFRGQVVVVDFWANWCGWCRQMYPQEREMVRRLKSKPFALVGINCDEDLAEVKRVVKRENLTWRSWFDGGRNGGRIRQTWQVDGFPTIYVLDHKGVIRYKNLRGAELDAAVEKLVKECESELRAEKR